MVNPFKAIGWSSTKIMSKFFFRLKVYFRHVPFWYWSWKLPKMNFRSHKWATKITIVAIWGVEFRANFTDWTIKSNYENISKSILSFSFYGSRIKLGHIITVMSAKKCRSQIFEFLIVGHFRGFFDTLPWPKL